MPKLYKQINRFEGLSNLKNARDIGFGLSKAQNISIDKHNMIRTIGGLEDFTKVDNVTALTQTAKICPGSGLFTYGSDHWRGTDTIKDILVADNAASDEGGEVDAVGSWNDLNITLTSVSQGDNGIANSGVDGSEKIIKGVITSTDPATINQSATTIVGQKYKFHVNIYNVDATHIYPYVSAPIQKGEIITTTGSWVSINFEFVALATTTTVVTLAEGDIDDIVYIDNAYLTLLPRSDLDTNWLALVDAPNAQVDLYNINDDSFTAALLDFGTVSSFVGASAGNVDFPTVSTITDSAGTFLNQGVKDGDVRIASGCTTTTANNIIFVVDRVTTGTIYARGSPFTVTASEAGTVTLTKYNPVAFHYVNEALRASPANGGVLLRPKHYSFADRTHFDGAGSSEKKFSGWFANDVGPVAPTDIAAEADAGDQDASALSAGAGWEVGITRTAEDGEWVAGTYIIACSFIYDDGQESALYVPSTDEEFGTAIVDGDSLTITVRGKNDYDERISGGRVYCRIDESDDPWSLLVDISIAKGVRATLSGTYNAWNESTTADVAYSTAFKSKRLNIDSYESLAGIDPATDVETFSSDNAFWNASVIAGSRCFIFAPRYTDASGNLQQFRDRIMYSQVNAHDTFGINNIVDVVKGDAENYVTGGIYGNDLLCFKKRTLYIVDISDPDPAGWQMKQDRNKGKYPFRGVRHPGAYFETPHGPAWCNEFGVFFYRGGEIIELLKDNIELSEHPLAYQRYMELDGSDDYVYKSNNASLNFGALSDFSLETIVKFNTIALSWIVNKGSSAGRYGLLLNANGTVRFTIKETAAAGGSEVTIDGGTTLVVNKWYHIIGTAGRDGDANLYITGVLDGGPTSMTAIGDIDNTSEPLAIGIQSSDLSTSPIDGDIALVHLWNRELSSAEALNHYNGQPVLAADQWGRELHTDANAASDPAGNEADATTGWDSDRLDLFESQGAVKNIGSYALHGHNNTTPQSAGAFFKTFTTITGGTYIARFSWRHVGSGGGWRVDIDGSEVDTIAVGETTFTDVEHSFTASSTSTEVRFRENSGTNDGGVYMDNFSLKQIGCVAEYAPKGIGDATWEDQSTNSLDGTVVGATAIFEDSWRKFYTDYSILGYQALTNQIIIMRDCTGKWSSGQDFGDAWIIDLDTGAITTGRRIFTKGIAYSNWCTDWENNLIIAEQTSATSVTIKRWTEEPQSQAAGLIDVRFADFDFDNPAVIKIIDAFVAAYKSSAAQTNPFSYAINNKDLPTAWTRLTGNFLATDEWKRLIIEPIANIECVSIRLKLDNPTSSTKIELNDSTVRNEPQILKLE